MEKDLAFSGLEAAIVLIAFVVVAAVFSYVMLGAGFFATQKSQEVTYSGIKQATSNLVLDGSLYGTVTNSGQTRTATITFYLAVPEGGQAQKLSDVDYTVTVDGNKYVYLTAAPAAGGKYFAVTNPGAATSGILKAGEKSQMSILFGNAVAPGPGKSFTVEIRPKIGAATLISKTLVSGYRGGAII